MQSQTKNILVDIVGHLTSSHYNLISPNVQTKISASLRGQGKQIGDQQNPLAGDAETL